MIDEKKFTKKDIKRIKRDIYSSYIIKYSFDGLVLLIPTLIIWAIIMFVFDDYDMKIYKLFNKSSNNYIFIIMLPLLINAFVIILCSIIKLINHFFLTKTINNYNTINFNKNDNELLQNAQTAHAVNIATKYMGNETLNTVSNIEMIKHGKNVTNIFVKKSEQLAQEANIKINKFICSIGIYLAVITSIIFIGTSLGQGIYTKKMVNDFITQKENKIVNIYKDIDINLKSDFSSSTKEIEYKINYDKITMYIKYDLEEEKRISEINYSIGIYDEEDYSMLSSELILKNIELLHSKLIYLKDDFNNSDIVDYKIQFSETFKNKIDTQRTKDEWRSGRMKYSSVTIYETFEAKDYLDDNKIDSYYIGYSID